MTWWKTWEYRSCVVFLIWDVLTSSAVAYRLFALDQGQATFLGLCILLIGVGYTGALLLGTSRWLAANPESTAPVGKMTAVGLSFVALILQAVYPYLK